MPIEIFAKFSDSSRRVLMTAQTVADEIETSVNSEHILIALATVNDTYAYKLLHQFTINIEQIKLILRLRGPESSLKSGLSPYVKKILELAAAQAVNIGNSRIDAEHLLLAITSFEDCLAYQIITRIGINPAQIRSMLLQLYSEIVNLDQLVGSHLAELPVGGSVLAPELSRLESDTRRSKTPALDYFGTNLTKQAQDGKLDPVVGRGSEISRTIHILARKTKNNPVLVGDAGVGKTAIVEGLAQRIARSEVPVFLKNTQIINLDIASVVAGTVYRGQFEDRLKKIINEAQANAKIILFVDEVHMLVGAGSAEGTQDASNILKPALAKGQLRLVGATTFDEYRRFIERDAALERRLQVVPVAEATAEQTLQILQGIKTAYEVHHGVLIEDEALKSCADLAARYISDRSLPDKAIDILDEAAAAARLSQPIHQTPPAISTLEQHLSLAYHEKEQALLESKMDLVSEYEVKIESLTQDLNRLSDSMADSLSKPIVNARAIAQIVAEWTNIPVGQISTEQSNQLINLEQNLARSIIGQDEAIGQIASAIRRAKTRVSDPKKPLGSFLFLGPSGVGKTELARVLASEVFGSSESLIKVDMSEFSERHTIARLLGAPAGYVGYDDGSKFVESIRKNPYRVILFDEIEKAHPEVLNILLQILEDGHVTDAKGRLINFRHSIILMTSNIGLQEFTEQASIGFRANRLDEKQRFFVEFDEFKKTLLKRLRNFLKPELINRLDQVVIFKPLTPEAVELISELQVKQLQNRLLNEGYIVNFHRSVTKQIAAKGFDPNFGARPIKRLIAQLIEEPLAMAILKSEVAKDQLYLVDVRRGGQLKIRPSHSRMYQDNLTDKVYA